MSDRPVSSPAACRKVPSGQSDKLAALHEEDCMTPEPCTESRSCSAISRRVIHYGSGGAARLHAPRDSSSVFPAGAPPAVVYAPLVDPARRLEFAGLVALGGISSRYTVALPAAAREVDRPEAMVYGAITSLRGIRNDSLALRDQAGSSDFEDSLHDSNDTRNGPQIATAAVCTVATVSLFPFAARGGSLSTDHSHERFTEVPQKSLQRRAKGSSPSRDQRTPCTRFSGAITRLPVRGTAVPRQRPRC